MARSEMRLTRREILKRGAALGAAVPLGGMLLEACGGSSGSGATTLNWLTWSDHFAQDQIDAIAKSDKLTARPKLFSDNADAILQIKNTGGQFDMVSGDALWVVKYNQEGLIDPIDLSSIDASKELYDVARNFSFWKTDKGYLGYPFSWSTVQMYYDPAKVTKAPTSWQDLTDKSFAGKIVAENIPTDLMAIAAKATGAKQPYAMTKDEIAKAKEFLAALKPNILKLASQNNEVVKLLADGSATVGITNLGTEDRVKDANGPTVKAAYPSEGTIGFIDSEMVVAKGSHKDKVLEFINLAERADYIAQNFITNGRPLFNQKAAEKLLADPKTADRAKRLYMDQPERALQMTLKGPAGDEAAYTTAFNEVFGA